MNILLNFLDLVALVIQIMGSTVMFLNGAKNRPDGAFVYAGNTDYETPKKRERRVKYGFGLLGIGFFIQLVSMVVKMATSH